MIPAPFRYAAPAHLKEAVALLNDTPGSRLLAGGQSLLTELKLRHLSPSLLVDLRNISQMHGIEYLNNGYVRIGAMTPLVALLEEYTLQERYPALIDAVNSIGDAQLRNRGTIGGNLASSGSLPGADLPAVALVLGAVLHIASPAGVRTIPANKYISSLPGDNAEVIVAIDLPLVTRDTASAYEKFKNRASCYAICGIAVHIARSPDGTLCECRVAVTGATRQAIRLHVVEKALIGKQPTVTAFAAASHINVEEHFISDLAASAEYRMHLVRVLTERALVHAFDRLA